MGVENGISGLTPAEERKAIRNKFAVSIGVKLDSIDGTSVTDLMIANSSGGGGDWSIFTPEERAALSVTSGRQTPELARARVMEGRKREDDLCPPYCGDENRIAVRRYVPDKGAKPLHRPSLLESALKKAGIK